jgi:hypothetical protein
MGKKGKPGAKKAAALSPAELEQLRAEEDAFVHDWGADRSKAGFEVIMRVVDARRLGEQPRDSFPCTRAHHGVIAFWRRPDAAESSSDDEAIPGGGRNPVYYFQVCRAPRNR